MRRGHAGLAQGVLPTGCSQIVPCRCWLLQAVPVTSLTSEPFQVTVQAGRNRSHPVLGGHSTAVLQRGLSPAQV